MGYLKINNDTLDKVQADKIRQICPFNAIEFEEDKLSINANCKLCKLCVKHSGGVITYVEEAAQTTVDKSLWKGIAVYGEVINGEIHPVTYELLGKANELASKINQPVYLLLIGHNLDKICAQTIQGGADTIYVIDSEKYKDFNLDYVANAFEYFVGVVRPSSVLIASTNIGRTLAPKIVARLHTGLTADCTMLDIKQNSDLVQIRPAFGGNIMAQIVTANNRPQFCTVRYKIFSPLTDCQKVAKIVKLDYQDDFISKIKCLTLTKKPIAENLSDADIILAVGRGVNVKADMPLINKVATLLNAKIGCTRPLVENGTFDAKMQIGLSGRTVKPKFILTVGISGAVQFTAGMENSDTIVAINADENAPIFDVCHYGFVADYKQLLTKLIDEI